MKKLLYFAIGMFVTVSFAQNNTQDNIWFNFQTPATDAVAEDTIGMPDTPFILKDKNGVPTNYTIAAYFEAISSSKISDIMIDINHMSAKFDRRGRQIIYLDGKIDLSCCFDGAITIDFYNADDKLIQKATTDAFGNFKIKSINGNMFEIKEQKIKFNFSKVKTFDQNADVRYASIERTKRPLGSDAETVQEKSIVDKVVNNNDQ